MRSVRGILTCLVIGAGSAHAQSDTRIAVVHFEEVVEASPAFAEASMLWTARLSELTAGIQVLQEEFKAAEERLTASTPPMEGEARTELVASMERLQAEIERRRNEVDPELNALRQSLLGPVAEGARNAVEQYARTRGFDIVIDSSGARASLMLVAEEIEITEEVIASIPGAVDPGPESADPDPEPLNP